MDKERTSGRFSQVSVHRPMTFFLALLLVAAGLVLGAGPKASFAAEGNVVEFFDSGSFDRGLSSALRGDSPEVIVKFAAPVTTNNIPERLDKWFSMVEKHGGVVKVEVDPEEKTDRGLFTEIISLVVGAYEIIKGKVIYEPVKNYNANVYYKPRSGVITRVVFTRKQTE